MKRTLVLVAIILFTALSVSAQKLKAGGRPRAVPTKPAEPCVERDFVQADDTDTASLCQNAVWVDIGAGGGGITNGAGSNVITKSNGTNLVASTLSDDGNTVSGQSVAITGILGPELTTNGTFTGSATGWTLGAGWAYGTNDVVHTPGSTATLSQSTVVPTAGQYYQVVVSISAQTAGALIVELGGGNATIDGGDGAGDFSFGGFFTTSAAVLTLTPDTDYDGTISSISVKITPKPFSATTHDGAVVFLVDPSGSSVSIENTVTAAGENNAMLSVSTNGDAGNTGGASIALTVHKDDGVLGDQALLSLDTNGVLTLDHPTGVNITAGVVTESMTLSAAADPIKFTNAAYQGCIALTTDVAGNLDCTASDARVKEKFNFFTRGLSAIRGLTPQTYQFRQGRFYNNGTRQAGLVAQNVQQFVPEAVSSMGDGTLQIDQTAITATLINAVRELDARLQKVERQNRQLRRQLRRK